MLMFLPPMPDQSEELEAPPPGDCSLAMASIASIVSFTVCTGLLTVLPERCAASWLWEADELGESCSEE